MKIKNNKLEEVLITEAENEGPVAGEGEGLNSVNNASVATIASEVQAAVDENTIINMTPEQAQKYAASLKNTVDELTKKGGDYAMAFAKDEDSVVHLLNSCLRTGLDRWKACRTAPESVYGNKGKNLLLYGPPGFGKTSGVEQWCKTLGIYLMKIPVSTLTKEGVAGIPWPVFDKSKGRYVQRNVEGEIWDPLFQNDKVVVFLDEVNTAAPDVTQTLLTFVCDRRLPITNVDSNGKSRTEMTFNNILFFVGAENPESSLFPGTHALGALDDRFQMRKKVEGDKAEFLAIIRSIYDAVLQNPYLSDEEHQRYEGQLAIAETVLAYKDFRWDTMDDLFAYKQKKENGELMAHAMNYRNFTSLLFGCDGTKTNFLWEAKHFGYDENVVLVLKNALATYVDKPKKGNDIWKKKQVAPQVEEKAKAEVESSLLGAVNLF